MSCRQRVSTDGCASLEQHSLDGARRASCEARLDSASALDFSRASHRAERS
jgi:hypothetical protein